MSVHAIIVYLKILYAKSSTSHSHVIVQLLTGYRGNNKHSQICLKRHLYITHHCL